MYTVYCMIHVLYVLYAVYHMLATLHYHYITTMHKYYLVVYIVYIICFDSQSIAVLHFRSVPSRCKRVESTSLSPHSRTRKNMLSGTAAIMVMYSPPCGVLNRIARLQMQDVLHLASVQIVRPHVLDMTIAGIVRVNYCITQDNQP